MVIQCMKTFAGQKFDFQGLKHGCFVFHVFFSKLISHGADKVKKKSNSLACYINILLLTSYLLKFRKIFSSFLRVSLFLFAFSLYKTTAQ